MTRAVARPAGISTCRLTDRVPKPITGGHFILKTDHVAWEWPRELHELASILNKLLDSLRLDLQLYPMAAAGTGVKRGDGRMTWSDRPPRRPLPRFPATRLAPPPPHMRGRGGTPWGLSASQPPVELRPYPPWVVGAGSGRVPGPKLVTGTAASATCRISGSLGGPEIR
jgi:hypothetical protein